MDDPLTAYHKDTSKKFFDNHYIPNSVIMFRQGIGRLIRTATDRGILVILDPRVITQRYGSTFLDSMPKMYWSPESQHAQQFMDGMDPEQIVG
jgi:ATP-dependent DNA helicase DinG